MKIIASFLLSSLIITVVFPSFALAKLTKTHNSEDRSQKIIETVKSIEEIQQQVGLAEDVKRNALKKLGRDLATLINDEIVSLTDEKDDLSSRNLSATSLNVLSQSYDEKINKLGELANRYALAKLLSSNGQQASAQTPASSKPAPASTAGTNPKPKILPNDLARLKTVNSLLTDDESTKFSGPNPFLKESGTRERTTKSNTPANGTTKSGTAKSGTTKSSTTKSKSGLSKKQTPSIKFDPAPKKGDTKITGSYADPGNSVTTPKIKVTVNDSEPIIRDLDKDSKTFEIEVPALADDNTVKIELLNGEDSINTVEAHIGEEAPEEPAQPAPPAGGQQQTDPKIHFDNVPENGNESVTGFYTDPGKSIDVPKIKIIINGDEEITKTIAKGSKKFKIGVTKLNMGDVVTLQLLDGDDTDPKDTVEEIVTEVVEPTNGGLFATMFGGLVVSNQAQQFNKADPFFGFQAGYGTRIFGINRDRRNLKMAPNPNNPRCLVSNFTRGNIERDQFGYNQIVDNTGRTFTRVKPRLYHSADGCDLKLTKDPFSSWKTYRISFRFQGLFSAEGRTAVADPEPAAGTPAATPDPDKSFRFIKSQQSFTPEITAWAEFNPLGTFSLGPYVAYGSSSGFKNNPFEKEVIAPQDESTEPVAATTKTDTDAKRYFEAGAVWHLKFTPETYFLQLFTGYGNYESFKDLVEKTPAVPGVSPAIFRKTEHRAIAKLRIFPDGLKVNFGRQINASPMFGIDINAGRGPDYIRFFTGFAIRLKGINIPEN